MKRYFMVKETYKRTEAGKKWGKQPAEVERVEVDEEYYNNIFNKSTLEFFKGLGGTERITKGYTIEGYIPVQLTSISPDKKTRIIRKFTPVR